MAGGTNQPEVLEGVIVNDGGPLYYTAREQQRAVQRTHAMVFLKRDAHLAEICARQAYRLMRQHFRECCMALSSEEAIVADFSGWIFPIQGL